MTLILQSIVYICKCFQFILKSINSIYIIMSMKDIFTFSSFIRI